MAVTNWTTGVHGMTGIPEGAGVLASSMKMATDAGFNNAHNLLCANTGAAADITSLTTPLAQASGTSGGTGSIYNIKWPTTTITPMPIDSCFGGFGFGGAGILGCDGCTENLIRTDKYFTAKESSFWDSLMLGFKDAAANDPWGTVQNGAKIFTGLLQGLGALAGGNKTSAT